MNFSKKITYFVLTSVFFAANSAAVSSPDGFFILNKRIPVGMNVPNISYSSPSLLFSDAMKISDFRDSAWGYNKFNLMPKDQDGYPTQVPYTIDGVSYKYFALFNTFYTGEYALLYDGEGKVTIGGIPSSVVDGVRRFQMPGIKTNAWVEVSSVTTGNP